MTFPTSFRRALMIIFSASGMATLAVLPVICEPAQAVQPTAAAPVRAGAVDPNAVDPNNTEMGWKNKQLERESPAMSSLRFTPKGVLGIDVSSHQGKVNWNRWVARGRTFAYIKATQGTSYRNPYFSAQYGGAYEAGMIRGAYHFANPAGKSGTKQARYFVAYGGGWSGDGKTLPGVLDIEYNPSGRTCYGLSKKKMVKWVGAFTVEYKRLTTRDAVIYTTLDWWTRCTGNTTKFSLTNPLWAARWGSRTPGKLPGAWPNATFWQFSAKYGSKPQDQNHFIGTPDRLVVLATGVEPPEEN